MKLGFVYKLFFLHASIRATKAEVARFDSACGFFNSMVYCFGGQTGNLTTNTPDSLIHRLDLTKPGDMATYANSWEIVTPNTNGVLLDVREHTQYTPISDHQLLVSGGFDLKSSSRMTDQSIVYDVNTNSWSRYTNYEEGEYGNRLIYYGTATFVPGKGAAFYGGFEESINANWTMESEQDLSATLFNSNRSRAIGYTAVTYLDITNPTSIWNIPSPQIDAPTVFSAVQSSLFYPHDNRIYYFGGSYEDTTIPGYAPAGYVFFHSFTYALYFDTTTNTWGNQTLSGSVIPTSRKLHTTTLLANHPTHALLYGGEIKGSTLSTDFCYTLDMESFTWTQHDIASSDGSSLLRSRHSVVVPNNDTVLIIFGVGGSQVATSTPVALNTSDIATLSYMSHFAGLPSTSNNITDTNNNNSNSTNTNANSDTSDGGSSKLSTGAIVGIAVGAAVFVIALVALVIFFCWRKRKGNQKLPLHDDQTTDQASHDQIEVNWDEIEKNYTEVKNVKTVTKPSEQSVDGSGTIFTSSEGSGVSNAIKYNNAAIKPHGENDTTSRAYFILKPDGNDDQ